MADFFCFNNLTHVTQPKNSHWCWAANLEKMINGLNSNSEIGTEDHELVSYYRCFLDSTENEESCIEESEKCLNIALKEEHLELIFDKAGFDVDLIEPSILMNYESIVTILNDCQSPIVLKTKYQTSHMELIIGYGKIGNCEYILISDPAKLSDINYRLLSSIDFSRVDKVWKTTLETENNLGKDLIIEKNYSRINKLITERPVEFSDMNLSLTTPWTFMNIETIKKLDKVENQEDLFSYFALCIDESSPQDSCQPYINRCLKNIVSITNSDEIFNRSSCVVKNKNTIVLKDYGVVLKVKNEGPNLLAKPISFPNDYSLEKQWKPYNQIVKTLYSTADKLKAFE